MTALDKISDFDEVMQFFERMLNFTKNKLRNNINIEELRSEAKEPTENELIAFYFINISSETLRIIQIEEQFYNVTAVNNEIDKFFQGNSLLRGFQVPENQTTSENYKIRQLRNSLAHSMYEIRFSKDGENAYLYLNNGKLKGAIKFEDFVEIADKYTSWYNNFCQYKNVGILSYDSTCLDIPDKKKAINKFVRSFKINNQGLNEKRIATLKKWIDKMGIDKFKTSSSNKKDQEMENLSINTMLSDMINCTAEKEDDIKVYKPIKEKCDLQLFGFLLIQLNLYFNNSEMQEYISDKDIQNREQENYSQQISDFQNFLDAKKDENVKKGISPEKLDLGEDISSDEYKQSIKTMLSLLSAKKPFVYSDIIMSLSYYIFNYVREVDKGREQPICDYMNIDTSGFKTIFKEEGREHIKKRNLQEEYEKETNPKKKEKIKKLISRYGNEVNDSSNFFRHIRDCIAHGWYEIDYSKYYNTRNVDEIMFSFPTYYPISRERDFEVQISAKNLIKVIENFREKINEGINLSTEGHNIEIEALKDSLVHRKIKTSDLQNNNTSKSQKQQNNRSKSRPKPNDDGR